MAQRRKMVYDPIMLTLPLWCLLGFVSWALVLVCAIGLFRVSSVLRGKNKSSDFTAGIPHGPDWYWRLNRAHLNTVENLPIFATLVLTGSWLHVESMAFTFAPPVIMLARVAQTIIHVSSNRNAIIRFRFLAYLVQVAGFFTLLAAILMEARS